MTNSPENALEDAGEETGNGAHDATTNLGTATAQDTMRGETTQSVGKSASDGVDVGDTVRLLPYPDTIQDRGIFKKCVNSQAVYPLSEQHGLEAQERR